MVVVVVLLANAVRMVIEVMVVLRVDVVVVMAAMDEPIAPEKC